MPKTNNKTLLPYVRFDGAGRVLGSSLIYRTEKPKSSSIVALKTTSITNVELRAFVRLDGKRIPISGSLVLREHKPKVGKWLEVQSVDSNIPTHFSGIPYEFFTTHTPLASGACLIDGPTIVLYTLIDISNASKIYSNSACTIPFNGLDEWWRHANTEDVYKINPLGVFINFHNCS